MKVRTAKLIILLVVLLTACGGQKKPTTTPVDTIEKKSTPQKQSHFDKQKAFDFVKAQTDFGPRVPGSEAHTLCADYLSTTLKSLGADVKTQEFSAKGYDGTLWKGKNIIGSYLPEAEDRIMFCAHWDSRFIAEEDKNKDLQLSPIDGANDGASGVGVLLEIARQLQIKSPNTGVDIIFFDVEDQGAPAYAASAATENSWCLGSQHWANEAVKTGYKARWGILLDMVGASDAVFMKEQISVYYAQQLVDYVWDLAAQKGYSHLFINKKGGIVTDDHLYVNRIAKIPCIDIIDYDETRGGFNPTWHTHNDNISNIDPATLEAVGSVLLELIRQQ